MQAQKLAASTELPRREESTQGHGTLGFLQKSRSGDPKRRPLGGETAAQGPSNSKPEASSIHALTEASLTPDPWQPVPDLTRATPASPENTQGRRVLGCPQVFLGLNPCGVASLSTRKPSEV